MVNTTTNPLLVKERALLRKRAQLETRLALLEEGDPLVLDRGWTVESLRADIIDINFLLAVIEWAKEVFFDKDGKFHFPSRFSAFFNWKFIKIIGGLILNWIK